MASSFTCVKKCVDVCARNAFCGSERFKRDDKICHVKVESEEAEADGINEEDEVLADLPTFDDILFGDNVWQNCAFREHWENTVTKSYTKRDNP